MKRFWCWLRHKPHWKFQGNGYVGHWIYECSICKLRWAKREAPKKRGTFH